MSMAVPLKAVACPGSAVRPIALAVAYVFAAGAPVWAAPVGEQVVGGQASVSRMGANTLVTQSSDRAAINWQSFSIGAGETVRFAQPSASSVALNRVLGQNPTQILGSLSANGQVFLVNPNGVLFGQGARVDVGGLVASTLGISNSDFLAGRYRFGADGVTAGTAQVSNAGDIIANGGYVALIGPQVINSGNIIATSGSVALAAGERVTLNLNGNKLIGLTVDKGALNALADNQGLIKADGGQVLLTAKAADQLIKSVVNNDGIVEAGTLKNVNGVIRLEGDIITNSGVLRADGGAANQNGGNITLASANDTTLAASSVISASGARGGDITVQANGGTLRASGRIEAVGHEDTGGTIKLLGERVGLMAGAAVDASGNSGGGTVLAGGDYQGKNANVQNAVRSYVDANASIKADAINSGDGGTVVVWADDITRFYGNISAKGGAAAGNGGTVEVSGKGTLDFNGSVNTLAANGRAGTLLLDPTNIEVVTGGTAALTDVDAFADADQTTCAVFGGAACSRIAPATINAAGATVTLQATNSIRFTNAISIATANVGLNATATAGVISVNAGITTKSGAVSLTGGSVTSNLAGTINTTGAAGLAGGNVSITSTASAVTLAGAITASGGAGAAAQAGGAAGSVNVKGATTVTTTTLTASGGAGGTGAGFAGGAGGAITVESNSTLVTGALTANGGNGGGTTAAGGNAGTISVTNLAAAGTVTTGTLTARAGAAVGAVVSGAAGSVSVKNIANALLQVGAIDTRGQAGGDGGSVSLISAGNVTETSTIQTTGGALNVGTTAAGRGAGNITISGVVNKITGAITASGGAGLGTNQAGGKASVVSITGTGVLTTAAITASTGAATGTGAGGAAGSITLSGTTATTGALTTTGGANGAGGNISVTGTSGAVTIGGAITSTGGNSLAAAVAGGNAGTITLDAGGATPTITLAGNLSALGGNKSGAGAAGAGAQIRLMDAVLLNAATVTVNALGGSAGAGAGGAVLFDGAVDSTGGARALVVNTNSNTVFGGAVGASSALQTLTTDAPGATKINGGAVTTVGTQTYNDVLTFGAATNLNTTNSAVTAVGTVTATSGNLTFATGTGDVTMNNAANDFGTVAVTSGKNITLRDSNALDLGASTISGTLTVNTTGAITQSGAVAVTGLTTMAAGTANNITQNNTGNDFGTVTVTSGNNVTFNDKNAMTAGPVTAGGNVLLQTATGAGNDLTLAGNIVSTTGGITLASGEDIHYGANMLTAATRWLTYSVAPANDTGTTPTPGNAKPNIYNSTFTVLGPGVVLPGTGNHHVYGTQPTITYTANAAARTYGAANPAFSGTVAGLVNGDTAADAYSGTASFASMATNTSNVGSYDITGSGLTSDIGYQFAQAPGNATAFTINAATLTYTANAANRLYGAADPAFSGTVSGFILGETQGTATTGALAFTTPAVANSSVGNYALNGGGLTANNGNYVFVQVPANATAFTINPATLTYTANAANRLYGAADPALSGTTTGFMLGETQGTATTGTLAFTSPAVANSNVGNYALNGGGLTANNGNYVFVQAPANATGFTINPATLTYTANAANRLYGAADPALSGAVTGFVLGETQGTATTGAFTFTTPAVANSNVGTYSLNGSGLTANNGNYVFVQAPGNTTAFTINPAIINLAGSRAYDATANFAGATFGAAGTINTGVGGQTLLVNGGPGTVASANVAAGVQTLTLGGLTLNNGTGLAGNYTLTGGTHTGTVTVKTVNLAGSRVYDGTGNFTAGGFTPTITGTVGAETLTLAAGSGTVPSANVAAGVQTLTTGTLTLGNGSGLAGNYTMTGGTHTGTITAKALTAAIVGTPTKVYNGNTNSILGPANFSLTGFVGAESATVTQTAGVYNSKDVLTANNVSANLAGGDFTAGGGTLLGNYTLPVTANGAGTITPAALTGNVTAANKVYDTTAVATLTSRTLTGVIGADVVTYNGGAATFADKNVGVGKVVNTAGLGLIGADAANYTVNATAVTNANISPAAIANVTGVAANNKVYDATTSATLNTGAAGFTGMLAGDVLTVATASGAFADKHAANGKIVNLSGITLGGTDAGNYTLTNNTAATVANITPAAIATVTGISANNKIYDVTAAATLNTVTAGFAGMFAGDVLTVATATGAFTDKNAASGKTVNISGVTLGGADAGNYTLTTSIATASANITPAVLTITYAGVNRVYDATATATVTTSDNRLGGDVLTINRSVSFADATAGIAKPVTVTGVALTGADAGNYTVSATGIAAADITARGITVAANNANKVYGNADPAFTFNVGGAGLAGADTITGVFTGALARAPGENVASSPYVINRGSLASNGNYSVTAFAPGQLTITPRALTIMADNKGGPVGQPLPPFTASYNGFAFNDTPANLIGTLAFATPATTASPPGAYAITPSGQSASNYSIAYVNGTLTLQPGASAIAGDVLSSINSGARQLPPPFLSGPFEGEGGPQSLATHLLSAVQPSNVAGDAQADGGKTGSGDNERPLLSGAVKKLVNIIDGGAKAPDPGGTLAPLGDVR